MNKPILCLDFDGVIHSYASGWKGAALIPDAPVEGAIDFLYAVIGHFDVQIFSSRSNQPGGIEAMQTWLYAHEAYWRSKQTAVPKTCLAISLKWPKEKPAAFVTIDDRAITFTGKWPAVEELKTFKPWNKR